MVFRRIGGLEINGREQKQGLWVFRRIGGLEILHIIVINLCPVFRRIGGLERLIAVEKLAFIAALIAKDIAKIFPAATKTASFLI